MSSKLNTAIAVAGIDIGKNSFHVIGLQHVPTAMNWDSQDTPEVRILTH